MPWIRVNQIIGELAQAKTVENAVNTDAITRVINGSKVRTICFIDQSDIYVSDSFEDLILLMKQGIWL